MTQKWPASLVHPTQGLPQHQATTSYTSQIVVATTAAVPAQVRIRAPPAIVVATSAAPEPVVVVAILRKPLSPPASSAPTAAATTAISRRPPLPVPVRHPLPHAPLLCSHRIRAWRGRIRGLKPLPPRSSPARASTIRGRDGRTYHARSSQGKQSCRRRPLTPHGLP
jgi:hypothetical protein